MAGSKRQKVNDGQFERLNAEEQKIVQEIDDYTFDLCSDSDSPAAAAVVTNSPQTLPLPRPHISISPEPASGKLGREARTSDDTETSLLLSKINAAFEVDDDVSDLDEEEDEAKDDGAREAIARAAQSSPGHDREADDEVNDEDLDEELARIAARAHANAAHQDKAEAVVPDEAVPADSIVLKVQCKQGHVKIRIGSEDTFTAFIGKLKQHALSKGWMLSEQSLRLTLDDEDVSPDDTPKTHDLEGDEVLDVIFYDA